MYTSGKTTAPLLLLSCVLERCPLKTLLMLALIQMSMIRLLPYPSPCPCKGVCINLKFYYSGQSHGVHKLQGSAYRFE
eukprot:57627-Amphidinium_carterae.1